jgi:hypothetical protein
MSLYKKYFKKVLSEDGPNYVPTNPNTAGSGGALGNSSNMYTMGSASGTTGRDTYAAGDFRMPKSIFGGVVTRRGLKKRKKKKK